MFLIIRFQHCQLPLLLQAENEAEAEINRTKIALMARKLRGHDQLRLWQKMPIRASRFVFFLLG